MLNIPVDQSKIAEYASRKYSAMRDLQRVITYEKNSSHASDANQNLGKVIMQPEVIEAAADRNIENKLLQKGTNIDITF